MEFRLAVEQDLTLLQLFCSDVVSRMRKNNILIWNDIYPFETLKEDIKNQYLYILTDENNIAGMVALCPSSGQENYLDWHDSSAKSLYMYRLAVSTKYLGGYVSSLLIQNAITITKEKNASYLRLFAVTDNFPAIKMYEKNNFTKVNGIYTHKFMEDKILQEYGFEINVEGAI